MALVWNTAQNVSIDLEGWTSPRESRTGAGDNAFIGQRRPPEQVFDEKYEEIEVPKGSARPGPR